MASPKKVEKIEVRVVDLEASRIEQKLQYDHLHEDSENIRLDLRSWQAGHMLPAMQPHPLPTVTPEVVTTTGTPTATPTP